MSEQQLPERLVVVVAGAGARGAYEAGALSAILPKLAPQGLGSTILLGTSAGAINVALWAARASKGRDLQTVGDEVKAVWSSIDQDRVFTQPLLTLPSTVAQYFNGLVVPVGESALKRVTGLFGALLPGPAQQLFGSLANGAGHVAKHAAELSSPVTKPVTNLLAPYFSELSGLLDTAPLLKTAREVLQEADIHSNVESGALLGIGVVATTSPMDGSGGRSRLFIDTRAAIPENDSDCSIDFVPTLIKHEHVVASAAIPVAFPPVEVTAPDGSKGWYIDGGVRLNAPIEPAIKLDATTLLIVSSHATRYPDPPALSDQKPDALDVGAQSIHATLADGMIEDLRTLRRTNRIVEQANQGGVTLRNDEGRPYRLINVIEVAPKNGTLSPIAARVFSSLSVAQRSTYWFLLWLLSGVGRGAGNNELLSYLLFQREYFQEQFKRGEEDALVAWRDYERQRRGGKQASPIDAQAPTS